MRSMAEFNYAQEKGREKFLNNPPFDVRKVLFGKPLCSFIFAEYLANKNAPDEDLFTNIHAKWLMSGRDDLRGKTPREILLEKQDFIGSDLDSRAKQWSFAGFCPPPIPVDSNAYKFAGFGTHEIVVYYDLFRHLLGKCFENNCTNPDILERLASDWLNNPQGGFSERSPAEIIEKSGRASI